MQDDYSRELSDLLVDSFDLVNKIEKNRLKGVKNIELTISELHVIESIGKEIDGISVREIASVLDITMPSVTVATRKLEEKGMVTKTKDPNDKRVVRVMLTPIGRKVYMAHEYFHQRMIRSILVHLKEEDKPTFMNAIRNLHRFFEDNSKSLEKKV